MYLHDNLSLLRSVWMDGWWGTRPGFTAAARPLISLPGEIRVRLGAGGLSPDQPDSRFEGQGERGRSREIITRADSGTVFGTRCRTSYFRL